MDRIRAQVRAAAPDVEITRLNAGSYAAGSLAMNVSPSLFGEQKLIEVDGLEAMNDAFLADALKYVVQPGTGRRPGAPPRRGSPRQEAAGRHQGRRAGPLSTASR